MRAVRAAELLLVGSGASRLGAMLRSGSRLILAYHNVVPDALALPGERSLHLALTKFREHLDALQESHDVVDLATLVSGAGAARAGRPRVAITFDDAYRGCTSLALPELERRGLPATVFVAPGLIGRDGCWWDQLAEPSSGTLPAHAREHILGSLAGDGARALEWARSAGLAVQALPAVAGIANETELLEASRRGGIRIAAHSWHHRNLSQLHGEALDREFRDPMDWLRQRVPGAMPWLAYPYGLHSPATDAAALAAGYEAVFRIFGGWMRPADDRSRILPRVNVPAAITTERFMLITRGMLPLH